MRMKRWREKVYIHRRLCCDWKWKEIYPQRSWARRSEDKFPQTSLSVLLIVHGLLRLGVGLGPGFFQFNWYYMLLLTRSFIYISFFYYDNRNPGKIWRSFDRQSWDSDGKRWRDPDLKILKSIMEIQYYYSMKSTFYTTRVYVIIPLILHSYSLKTVGRCTVFSRKKEN